MYGGEKSDGCVVPLKPSNKAGLVAAERVEGRCPLKGSMIGRPVPDIVPDIVGRSPPSCANRRWMGRPKPECRSVIARERSPSRASRTMGSVRGRRAIAGPTATRNSPPADVPAEAEDEMRRSAVAWQLLLAKVKPNDEWPPTGEHGIMSGIAP